MEAILFDVTWITFVFLSTLNKVIIIIIIIIINNDNNNNNNNKYRCMHSKENVMYN